MSLLLSGNSVPRVPTCSAGRQHALGRRGSRLALFHSDTHRFEIHYLLRFFPALVTQRRPPHAHQTRRSAKPEAGKVTQAGEELELRPHPNRPLTLSHCNTARLCLLRSMFKRSVPPVSLFIAALMPTKARNQEPRHRLVSQANIAANLEDSGNETTLVCFASLRKILSSAGH